jgi:hypothetical protein
LRAPQLVRVLEIHDEPELFVVMEYVQGATLRALSSRAPAGEALRYLAPLFIDVLGGLSALHNFRDEEGAPGFLVHQAPCARHMLAGIDGVTRLIDLSSAHSRGVAGSHLDRRAAVLAPEQRAGSTDLDPRCDIFLVGIALQEALACATRDGEGAQDAASLRAQCAPLRAIAERAAAPKRSDRFWSADELGYALQRAAVAADLLASREDVGAWVRRMCVPASAPKGLPRVNAHALAPVLARPSVEARDPARERTVDARDPARERTVEARDPARERTVEKRDPARERTVEERPARERTVEVRDPARKQEPGPPRTTKIPEPPALPARVAPPALSGSRPALALARPTRRETLPFGMPPPRASALPLAAQLGPFRASASRSSLPAVLAPSAAPSARVTPLPAPSFAAPRESVLTPPLPVITRMPAPPTQKSGLRRLGSLAGGFALLTSAFALGVRGFHETPMASAARLRLDPVPALPALAFASEGRAEPRPIVTSLAPPPRSRSAATPKEQPSPAASALLPTPPASPASEPISEEEASASTIDSIAASIEQVNQARQPKNLVGRPRQLRSQLPENPY